MKLHNQVCEERRESSDSGTAVNGERDKIEAVEQTAARFNPVVMLLALSNPCYVPSIDQG